MLTPNRPPHTHFDPQSPTSHIWPMTPFFNEVLTSMVAFGININPSKKVLHIQFGGQYLPQYNIFCYMSYLIMEAWLSSFPMIPIPLVYSVCGMNGSFMNGVGVPSVKCQISITAGIGGQYIFPNVTFSTKCLILLRKPGYPAFPWSQYHWCTVSVGWMTASWMEALWPISSPI